MSEPIRTIPLFPLGLVLFPDSRLHLHIFEERYKTMIRASIAEGVVFGINLLQDRYMHPVGCTAEVERVSRSYPDGSFDVVVRGVDRYTVTDYHEAPDGYFEGVVELFTDTASEVPERLRLDAAEAYNSIIDAVFSGQEDLKLRMDETLGLGISYAMAEKAGLDLLGRQRLLELRTEAERLDSLLVHMQRLLPLLVDGKRLREVSANDGYLPRGSAF